MYTSILSRLPADFPWRDRIHYFDTIHSTNTHAKLLAADGAETGTIVIAGHQSGGRGRLGRSFHSPAGSGIYMSVILRPQCLPTQLMHLTCAAGIAMCDAIGSACGLDIGIKWINDLVHNGRKLGGILTELALTPSGMVDYAVVGIGINCRQRLSEFPEELQAIAGSLAIAAGHPIDTAAVAAAMLISLEAMSRNLLTEKTSVMALYRSRCVTVGKEIRLIRGGETKEGTALDIDEDGALLVTFRDGTTAAVNSGEVSVRGMYGYV